MKRWFWPIMLLLAAVMVCGCIPRRMFWSPDGQRAVIIAEDGLRLCDADGKLSDPVAKGVDMVVWSPDSRRFIAARTTKAKTWEQAAAVLSPERREALLKAADQLLAEMFAYSGDWDEFKPQVAAQVSEGELAALLLYLREHRRTSLPEKLAEKWKGFETIAVDLHLLEPWTVSDSGAAVGPSIVRTLDAVTDLRISPDGRVVACTQRISSIHSPGFRLSVFPVDGGSMRMVADPVAAYPDWTSDGRRLVYATTHALHVEGDDSLQLGTIAERNVCDASGAVLKEFGAPQDLVGLVFSPHVKIRCLPDGRVLFCAVEVTLPVTSKDMPRRASLFTIDPARQATVARLIPRDAEANLPDGLAVGGFEVSPDASRIAVSDSRKSIVCVLTVASGAIESVVNQPDAELRSLPVWRNSQELCLIVPPKYEAGSPDRYEIVLWSGRDRAGCLSCRWPSILDKKTAASTPAESEPR